MSGKIDDFSAGLIREGKQMGEARPKGEVVVYQGQDGALRVEAKVAGESIWLPMANMAKLFGVKAPALSKHVKNIYATRELSPRATVSKMETVRRESRRQVARTNGKRLILSWSR